MTFVLVFLPLPYFRLRKRTAFFFFFFAQPEAPARRGRKFPGRRKCTQRRELPSSAAAAVQCFHRETAGYRFSRNPLPIPTGRKPAPSQAKGSIIFLLRTLVPNGPPCETGAGMRPNTQCGRFPSLPGGLFVKLPGSHAWEVLPEHGTYMERPHQNETANAGNPVRAKTFCKPSRSRTRKYLSVLGT